MVQGEQTQLKKVNRQLWYSEINSDFKLIIGDNIFFNIERDQNQFRMLELWTNFIKYLDPTPPDHLSEVLDDVSWTQVLIYICKCSNLSFLFVISQIFQWLKIHYGWQLPEKYPKRIYHTALIAKIHDSIDSAIFWTRTFVEVTESEHSYLKIDSELSMEMSEEYR